MTRTVDINCDMGSSFGVYERGDDAEVMPYVTSANISAGFHGGDPHVIRETVQLATDHGVTVGVHPRLPDRMGFGLRRLDATPEEISDYVLYQLGALGAFAEYAGVEVSHVKPHGALYAMLSEDASLTRAVLAALEGLEGYAFVASDCHIARVAADYDVPTAIEGYVDISYRPDGRVETDVTYSDPETVADRFVELVDDGRVGTVDGDTLEFDVDTVCIHGNFVNAVPALKTIHRRLSTLDVELTRLDELLY